MRHGPRTAGGGAQGERYKLHVTVLPLLRAANTSLALSSFFSLIHAAMPCSIIDVLHVGILFAFTHRHEGTMRVMVLA